MTIADMLLVVFSVVVSIVVVYRGIKLRKRIDEMVGEDSSKKQRKEEE